MPSSQILTGLAVDAPRPASATFDAPERAYIDEQIRGCETHLVDSLVNGVVATWFRVDSTGDIAKGDVVLAVEEGKIRKATHAQLAVGLRPIGVALAAANIGAMCRVAVGGLVGSNVTGLGNVSGYVRVTSAGRAERVLVLSVGDWPLGVVNGNGAMLLDPARQFVGGGDGGVAPCRLATTGNDSRAGLAARDGVTPVAGNRVLVWQQSDPAQNGIYIADGVSDTWPRAPDFDQTGEVVGGTLVAVQEGSTLGEQIFQVTTTGTITVGTTGIVFEKLPNTADKAALDAKTSENTPGTIVTRGGSGEAKFGEVWSTFVRALSGTVATVGLLRGVNASTLVAARGSGAFDVACLGITAGDQVDLGENTNAAAVAVRVKTGGFVGVFVNDVEKVRFTGTPSMAMTGSGLISATGSLTIQPATILVLDGIGGWFLETSGAVQMSGNATGIAFFTGTPVAKQTVSGSRADPEAALANLLTALANYNLITNSTTA